MLDLAVFLALEVRRDCTILELAERFGPLLLADPAAAERRRWAAAAAASRPQPHSDGSSDGSEGEGAAAEAVAACGVAGVVAALVASLNAAAAVGRVLKAAPDALGRASDGRPPPRRPQALSPAAAPAHGRFSLDVEVVSAAGLANPMQASGFLGSMASPFVRVSLERRYGHGPQPFKPTRGAALGGGGGASHGRDWFETAVARKNLNPQWRNQALAEAGDAATDGASAREAQFKGTLGVGSSFWGVRLRCEARDAATDGRRSLGVAYVDLFGACRSRSRASELARALCIVCVCVAARVLPLTFPASRLASCRRVGPVELRPLPTRRLVSAPPRRRWRALGRRALSPPATP